MYLFQTENQKLGRHLIELLIFVLLALLANVFIVHSHASALTNIYPTRYSRCDPSYTIPDTSTASCFYGNPQYNPGASNGSDIESFLSLSVGVSGSSFQLWDQNGNASPTAAGESQANRTEGNGETQQAVEVGGPDTWFCSVTGSGCTAYQKDFKVKVVDACMNIKDSFQPQDLNPDPPSIWQSGGWQDHTNYDPTNSPGKSIWVEAEGIDNSNSDYGSPGGNTFDNRISLPDTSAASWRKVNCDQVSGRDITLTLRASDFQRNNRYGSVTGDSIYSLFIRVNKYDGTGKTDPSETECNSDTTSNSNPCDQNPSGRHPGQKIYAIDGGSLYVTPMNIAPAPSTAGGQFSNGSTYASGHPQGNDSLYIRDPRSDYMFNTPGSCTPNSSSHPTWCGGYSIMDRSYWSGFATGNANKQNPASTYVFDFQPDCSFLDAAASIGGASPAIYLKWSRGNPTATQNDMDVWWTLKDLTTGKNVAVSTDSQSDTLDGDYVDGNNAYHVGYGSESYDEGKVTGVQYRHHYEWVWHNIDRAHGITVWLPFSEMTTPDVGIFDPASCPSNPPTGVISGAQCVNGVTGTAQDPDSPNTDIKVAVAYQIGQKGYFPGPVMGYTGGTSTTTSIYGMTAGVYSTDSSHAFRIPIPSTYLNGYEYKFFVFGLGVNIFGQPDTTNTPWPGFPGTTYPARIMLGCEPFTAQGASNVILTNSNSGTTVTTTENPTTYKTSSQGGAHYDNLPAASLFKPTLTMGCNVYYGHSSLAPPPVPYPTSTPSNICVLPDVNLRSGTNIPAPSELSGAVVLPPQAGDQYCSYIHMQYGTGIIDENSNIVSSGVPANFNPPNCKPIVNEPYFRVYGNNVSAGAVFTGTCSTGEIAGWNNDSGVYPGVGSGTQLSAIATSGITGFGSGQFGASFGVGAPVLPNGTNLTLANTGPGINVSTSPNAYPQDSPGMGGAYGYCLTVNPDTPAPGSIAALSPGTITNSSIPTTPSTSPSGDYVYDYTGGGTLYINGNLTINPGVHVTIYTAGNVRIGGNVSYQGDGSWAINNMPSFKIVTTKGNIYVDAGVHELDGIYEAQPSSSIGGTIYTCDNSANGGSGFGAMPSNQLFTKCNTQLTVFGSFIAQQVDLERTFGSLRDSTGAENPYAAPVSCSWGGSASVCSAELFNFSPELYLTNPNAPSTSGLPTPSSITSLPPVL